LLYKTYIMLLEPPLVVAPDPAKAVRQNRSEPPTPAFRPRFARHALHVAAVIAAGGYPAIRS